MNEPPQPGGPGVPRVGPRRTASRYAPAWWEKRFPWLIDVLIALDPEPLGARLGRLLGPAGKALEAICVPIASGIDRAGAGLRRVRLALDRAATAFLAALPLPGFVQRALWLRPVRLGPDAADSAHAVWRRQHRRAVPIALMIAVAAHAAVFLLWPTMEAENAALAAAELEAIDIPPDVSIPPPPEEIARPATPILATTPIDEDITIAPTTFDENPVVDLPPPPVEEVVEERPRPTFTPFTVAPEILNKAEVQALLISEYPPVLRDAGVGGEVVMWFYIDETGKSLDVRIARGSGYEQLDAAAYRVAEAIEFSPGLNRDEYVKVWVQFPIQFSVR